MNDYIKKAGDRMIAESRDRIKCRDLRWEEEHRDEILREFGKFDGDMIYESVGEANTNALMARARDALEIGDYAEFGRLVGPCCRAYLWDIAVNRASLNYELQCDFERSEALTASERNGRPMMASEL